MDISPKVPFKEKLAYGAGDAAFNFIWMTFIYYLLFFYTDVFGISAAAVGTLLLATRIWDTVNDPLMGMLADRTKSRWGRFRPYLLFGAIPLGISAVLCFTTPDLSPSGKLIYAYITYFALGMIYTANNIPYSSLMGVISQDPKERTALSSFRFMGAYGASIFVLYFTNDLVKWFGKGNAAAGFQMTMMVYALITVLLLLAAFNFTRERVQPVADRKAPFWRDLLDILTNAPFIVLFMVGIFTLAFVSIRNGITIHYFKYYILNEEIAKYFMTGAAIMNLLGVACTKLLTDRFDKKGLYIVLMAINAVLMAVIYFATPNDLYMLFGVHFFSAFLSGPTVPIVFAMYADIADYSESIRNRRATGLVFAGASFSQKMGWTIGGSASGFLLAFYNYQPNAQQTVETLDGIRMMFSVIPGICAGLAAGIMLLYPLNDRVMQRVSVDLAGKKLDSGLA